MATLGSKYYEISRGYEKVSNSYHRPYILGVNINEPDKPFIIAIGDHHSDMGTLAVSVMELISGKYDEEIIKSNGEKFVNNLKIAFTNGESFPQRFILNMVTNNKVQ